VGKVDWTLVLIVLGLAALVRWVLVQVGGGGLLTIAPIDVLGAVLLLIGLMRRSVARARDSSTSPPPPPPQPPQSDHTEPLI
jgi:hypothetical protein